MRLDCPGQCVLFLAAAQSSPKLVEMYRVQSQWANCCTQTAYITSLATWADAAKDYYFNSSTEEAARGDKAADHPFQLGAAPWVIRSHSFLFHEQRRYHSCTDYRSHLAWSTEVTRLGKTSLDLEHGIYHERSGQSPRLVCQIASSIIVFSDETGRPAAHGMEIHKERCSTSVLSISKDLGTESNFFRHKCQPRFLGASKIFLGSASPPNYIGISTKNSSSKPTTIWLNTSFTV